jgi:MFS family permease
LKSGSVAAEPGAPKGNPGRVHFFAVSATSFFISMGSGLIIPLLPAFQQLYGLSVTQISLLPTSFFAGRLLVGMLAGVVADRVGARWVANAGCILTGIGAFAAWWAPSYPILLAAQVLQGIGAGIYTTAAITLVIGALPKGRVGRGIGIYQAINLLGFSFGPTVGGIAAAGFGPKSPFIVYTIVAFGGLLVSIAVFGWSDSRGPAVHLPQRAQRSPGDASKVSVGALLKNRTLMMALLVVGAGAWVSSGVRATLIPLFAQDSMNVTSFQNGLVLTISALGQMAALAPMGHMLDRFGRRRVILASLIGVSAALVLLSLVNQIWMLFAVSLVMGVCMACQISAPSAILVDVLDPRHYGSGVGMQRSVLDAGKMVAPVTIGVLVDALDYKLTFLVGALLLGGITAFLTRMPETSGATRIHSPEEEDEEEEAVAELSQNETSF